MDVLLEAAAQMFSKEGLSTTTDRIAERAGMSVGTLYQYFPNKQAMLYSLAERHLIESGRRLGAVLSDLRRTLPPFEVTMRTILDVVMDLHSSPPAVHALMHRLVLRHIEELEAVQAFEEYLATEVAFHLERCGRGGDDSMMTARAVIHGVDAQVHRVRLWHPVTTDSLLELVCRLAPENSRMPSLD
ncbi:TetR/AcrR family transcriptional regulator [Nocardia puris]|uniref:TetR family transcriptional regulator n=1 Tax=Nocardia puris TaxID=208602 RepID=A0A366E5L4_9NOCA|nr:TetR/AcrR family transcriptional regulator [Nocardia puris]RBO96794.1 TetR family transcriptional regulator [Nocardia puris]